MSLGTLLKELGRFIKDHLKQVLVSSILVALLVMGLRLFLTHLNYQEVKSAYQDLEVRYGQEPAEFQMVVGLEDGTLFNNSYVFDEYFSQAHIVDQIEAKTGIKFGQWLENERLLELYKTAQFRGGLAAVRNTSSDVITVRILVGQTAEENLAIAKAYQDLVEANQIEFLSTHAISILSDAAIGELLPLETTTNIATPDSLNLFARPNAKSAIIYGVAGFILGAILSIAVLFIMRLAHKEIRYAFEYTWQLDESHLLINQQNETSLLQEALRLPTNLSAIILAQHEIETLLSQSHLAQVSLDTANQTVMVIVEAGQTDKVWFRQQMELVRLAKLPVCILHLY